ncbi:VOC family protein [Aestuariispira ectoiniformans]|uniref:VOC family protein n=1 Tax=Aestuariispira ectoiniformans TaxID=2775080 RepID=UPI00223C2B50|nr:VOC family protein [Aestuariispira ectoiniformans]
MTDTHYIILYVNNPQSSADFYADLLGREPVEKSATFALFPMGPGLMLGLWSKHTVEPATTGMTGGMEVAFSMTDAEEVDKTYDAWVEKKITVAQVPTDMDFGHSFVALDPDGHRLRVFSLSPDLKK